MCDRSNSRLSTYAFVSAKFPNQKQKLIKSCCKLYEECLKQDQNQAMADKIENLQSKLTDCQSIFPQVLIAISPGAK